MNKIFLNNQIEMIYSDFPVELIEHTKRLVTTIKDINEIFDNNLKKDLYRKRLLITVCSSYFENSIDIILHERYVLENDIGKKLLNNARKTGLSGFNIIVINKLMKIIDDDMHKTIESIFSKRGNGRKLKESLISFNELRNTCSHTGDLTDTNVSKVSIDSIYSYIIEGLIVIYIIYSILDGKSFDDKLEDVLEMFGHKII